MDHDNPWLRPIVVPAIESDGAAPTSLTTDGGYEPRHLQRVPSSLSCEVFLLYRMEEEYVAAIQIDVPPYL